MTKPRLKWVASPEVADWEGRLMLRIRASMFHTACSEIDHLARKLKRPPYLAECKVSTRDGWTVYETTSWLTPLKIVERFVVLVEEDPGNRVVVFERLDDR